MRALLVAVCLLWACGDDLEVAGPDAGVAPIAQESIADRVAQHCGPYIGRIRDGQDEGGYIKSAEMWMECADYYTKRYTCD